MTLINIECENMKYFACDKSAIQKMVASQLKRETIQPDNSLRKLCPNKIHCLCLVFAVNLPLFMR